MIRFFLNKPIAVITIFVALVLLGLVMAEKVPISPLPDINLPEITVHLSRKNTANSEIEKLLVAPIRSQLSLVNGVTEIKSDARDDAAQLNLKFSYDTDVDIAYIEINEKIDLAMNSLPKDMERPLVIKSSATNIPVVFLNLTLKKNSGADGNLLNLSEFANQIIKRRLEELPEIAFVDITGLMYSQISIIPNPAAMAALNLRNIDFSQIVADHNFYLNNVKVKDGILEYNVQFSGTRLTSIDDIKEISFIDHGTIFKLKDVATINETQQDPKGLFVINDQPGINMALLKQPNCKMAHFRSNLRKLLDDVRSDYPDIVIEESQDQTELLDFSIRNLKQDLFVGCLIAFLLMFIILRSIRSPFLIGITVPVGLVLCVLFFGLIHLTINIISLSGLVLGVGLMIDNSIIVIDSISHYRNRGLPLQDACIKGTTDVIRPLFASALTTSSVFLPLIFLNGLGGALFYDQAIAVTVGLFISLTVSVTLLPVLYHLIHKPTKRKPANKLLKPIKINTLEKIYKSLFTWTFNHKVICLLIVGALISISIFLLGTLKREKFPAFDRPDAIVKINWNRNITISENRSLVKNLLKFCAKASISSEVSLGEQQYLLSKETQMSSSDANLYIKATNSKELYQLKKNIYRFMYQYHPEAVVEITAPKDIFQRIFSSFEADLVAKISETGTDRLPRSNEIDEISNDLMIRYPKAQIKQLAKQRSVTLSVDADRLLLYDLTIEKVYSFMKERLNAVEIGEIQSSQIRVPIVLAASEQELKKAINGLIVNNKGVEIPLDNLIKITYNEDYKTIEGGRNGNYIALQINTDTPEDITNYVKNKLKNTGMEVSFSGSFFANQELIKEMGFALLIAVLLLYFILAAQFESLIQPLIVLLELPISMSGGLLLLYFSHSSLNLSSMIGLIVMCGIVINDSILKIDTVNRLIRVQGMPLTEALHTAGLMRLKSILMTAMTTVISVLPFLFGSDIGSLLQRPLSLVIIGGMAIGTPVSLYFIPLMYWLYYRNRLKTRNF